MAHLIEKMALVGQPAWHGLGNYLTADASIEEWKIASGLNYRVNRSYVRYPVSNNPDQEMMVMDNRVVLWRSDTNAPLAVVSSDYKVFQPEDVLEFYRDLTAVNGMTLETAGVLAGGKRVWALAKTNNAFSVGGVDVVKQYLLLATSYDGTFATTAKNTAVRVVCNNTLTLCLHNGEPAIKVPHSTDFNANRVKLDLGLIGDEFTEFGEIAEEAHKRVIDMPTAVRWYANLLMERDDLTDIEIDKMAKDNRVLKSLLAVYSQARGQEETAWGWINGVTALVDHVRGRSASTRLDSAWFGQGDTLKRKALDFVRDKVTA